VRRFTDDVQNERMDVIIFPNQLEYAQQYGVDKTLLDSLNIVIMHPGPINRGKITSEWQIHINL
jgi:aspartate carbamoyltransferase catalytic subunit